MYYWPNITYTLSADIYSSTGSTINIAVLVDGSPLTNSELDAGTTTKTFVITDSTETDISIKAETISASTSSSTVNNIVLKPTKKNILNHDGLFYGCNLNSNELDVLYYDNYYNLPLIESSKNLSFCQIKGDYFYNENDLLTNLGKYVKIVFILNKISNFHIQIITTLWEGD